MPIRNINMTSTRGIKIIILMRLAVCKNTEIIILMWQSLRLDYRCLCLFYLTIICLLKL